MNYKEARIAQNVVQSLQLSKTELIICMFWASATDLWRFTLVIWLTSVAG